MRIVDCEQGTAEWLEARLGLPTASQAHRILTPKTMKPSSSQEKYMCELLAERLLNEPLNGGDSAFMQRGSLMEAEAVRWVEFQTGLDTRKIGFCTTDDGRFGCSPDRLIGDDGGMEIKCPSAAVHVATMLGLNDSDHKAQIQGCLWVTGRSFWYSCSYNRELPPTLVRVERDEAFIEALAKEAALFSESLEQNHRDLAARMGLVAVA
jgi:hypothetical protein